MTLEEFVAVIRGEGGKAASDEALSAFERRMDLTLPQELKHFLKCCGGGRVIETPVEYLDERGAQLIPRRMYSLDEMQGAFNSPVDSWVPKALLSIGVDEGGNTIMLCLRKDRFGQIFLFDHECVHYPGDDECPDTIETIEEAEDYRLGYYAPSFRQFLDDLRVVETV
ncbi:SMI1/KNR4 family protein [uncultured Microbulbifer sp.]|uniref:SMI1/KNR4 family protein n=1 Tax=uncultured Microbulbifer sp. TaxID=348147 RepID=UPI00261A3CAA|nr:SMI1/KNR4 family protein [uncultured Microbulbifer sp.]